MILKSYNYPWTNISASVTVLNQLITDWIINEIRPKNKHKTVYEFSMKHFIISLIIFVTEYRNNKVLLCV